MTMKEIKIETTIQFCQLENLEEADQQLVKKAIIATKNSYSQVILYYFFWCSHQI